jgi:hypothetical protein
MILFAGKTDKFYHLSRQKVHQQNLNKEREICPEAQSRGCELLFEGSARPPLLTEGEKTP